MRRRASSSSSAPQLGMFGPLAFVGRSEEIAAIQRGLGEQRVVVLHGPAGSGKSRLAAEVTRRLVVGRALPGVRRSARVVCHAGDGANVVRARAERALDLLPGALTRSGCAADSSQGAADWLLVIDDLDHLSVEAAHALLGDVAGHAGHWIVIAREPVSMRRAGAWFSMEVGGLVESDARDLWSGLEGIFGPTRHDACDRALGTTRALPLELARAHARAVFGHELGDALDRLPARTIDALAALSLLRLPASQSEVAGIVARVAEEGGASAGDEDEDVFFELSARQLIEPLGHGVYRVYPDVRALVREGISPDRRERMARAIMDIKMADEERRAGATSTLDTRDASHTIDAPWSTTDPVVRMREAVYHAQRAGGAERALALIRHGLESNPGRGAHDELMGLLESLAPALDDDRAGEVAVIRMRAAMRHGRVSEALESSAQAGDACDRVESAYIAYRGGDIATARRTLGAALGSDDADLRSRAAALMAELELSCADPARSEELVTRAFERDRAAVSETVRARLHMALAAVEEHAGRVAAARASLSRAASSGRLDPALSAAIEARRCACLLAEGRSQEAATAIAAAERMALGVDAMATADEIRRVRALCVLHRGDALDATESLRDLVLRLRQRGDEMGALRAEIDLARAHIARGALAEAAELVSACIASTARRKLTALRMEMQLVGAMLDMTEMRSKSARIDLEEILDCPGIRAEVRAEAAALLAEVYAWQGRTPEDARPRHGERAPSDATHADPHDPLARMWADARIAAARGDAERALDRARTVAARAERAGRRMLFVDALAMCARLSFARGERATAHAEAARAARESEPRGLLRAHTHALLVLAALARDGDDPASALDHVRAALESATRAGLPIARLVAAEALDALGESDAHGGDDLRHAARATMSQPGLEFATRILSELGLTAVRPFRVVSAGGSQSLVADITPERLRLAERALVIDAVREVIMRDGETVADLRRRSLLKRLIYLLGASPGRVFSKEELVETVWRVNYHPLRHDAALFTNIMRIRRLLGEDGADIVRVCEDGYRLLPPADFLYLEAVDGR